MRKFTSKFEVGIWGWGYSTKIYNLSLQQNTLKDTDCKMAYE
ncbi:MAG: hypothetical protein ACI9VN_003679 [Patescibacteria group bacterium]|jgi:hypothetical protein